MKKKNSCTQSRPGKKFLHWPSTHFAQISGSQAGKHTLCKTSALWITFLLNFGLVNNHTWHKKIYLRLVNLYTIEELKPSMAPGITMMDYGRPGTYVPFKNGTIVNIFIIINIIVNTLFLYNIIRMPYFVARDELTLATFLPWLVVRNAVYM